MKKYVVTAVKASFAPGSILKLSPELAKPRLHNLQKIDHNIYSVEKAVEFKRGTELEYDGDVNKARLQELALADSAAAKAIKAKEKPLSDLSEEQKQVIVDAVSQLDPDNEKHWTGSGEPAVTAVRSFAKDSKISRDDITAAAPDLTREFLAEKSKVPESDIIEKETQKVVDTPDLAEDEEDGGTDNTDNNEPKLNV